ncbi:HAD-IIB family hydrolase [Alphaproteobacteria bacterium KMM 3653]|uniref:HAD-IIB family hydrolase n=1 Tax=Harenicola maris TaxID=2841044 RepID=A0AAP2CRN8_9RHOB|nr:HAD-IIB family hydrolase [Harenicola maris]
MAANLQLMVFTDLDGTLIDHDTYDWRAAKPALAALRRLGAGLILSSSKTAAEIAPLRAEIDQPQWPGIVENGAGLLPPHDAAAHDAAQYTAIREALQNLPDDLAGLFHGFGDCTPEEVAEMTGLPLKSAMLAKHRAFSEPGQWRGNRAQKTAFLAHLKTQGISAQQGGRFLTLSFGGNKADQMRAITAQYKPQHTIALGDAPNDVQMLEAADTGVVIANPHRPPLPELRGEAAGRIIRTKAAGPLGWNEAILSLINRLELN